MDAFFLNVLPVLAAWQALTSFRMTASWPGRLLAGTLAMFASLFVTAVYHLGYAEFRGPELVRPLIGHDVMTLGYSLATNPLARSART